MIARQRALERPATPVLAASSRAELLTSLIDAGADRLMVNANGALLRMYSIAGQQVPVAVCPDTRPRAAILSPTAHYLDYPIDEIGKASKFWTPGLLRVATQPLRQIFKVGQLDRVAYINHSLMLGVPPINGEVAQLEALMDEVADDYPRHALVFSNIVPAMHPGYAEQLRTLGCLFIPSRVNWVYDPNQPRAGGSFESIRARISKGRRALARLHENRIGRDGLLQRLSEVQHLFEALYIDKHSRLNPHYTEAFFRRVIASDAIEATGWIGPNGNLEAFNVQLFVDGVLIWSVKGHDLEAMKSRRLNEVVFAHNLEAAERSGCWSSWGGGTGDFKRGRGAEPAQEFDAVFLDHLPAWRRAPWHLLHRLRAIKAPSDPFPRSTLETGP